MNRRVALIALLQRCGGGHLLPGRSWRARQQGAAPLIGFLHSQTADAFPEPARISDRDFAEGGYVEGTGNLTIEYRWAQNQADAGCGVH